jgi:hypothetical protein
MTYSWFGFNAIVLTHLFELTFKFTPIVKGNISRTGITRQPGIMKQILDGSSRLELAWTISSHPVAGSIIVRASKECVLSG